MSRPIISGERIFLRPFERSDAETYRRWRADAEPMALAGWPERAPLSQLAVERRIERLAEEQGREAYSFLICLLADERPIGEAMLVDIDRRNGSAQLGIFIGEQSQWGKGHGTDAVKALLDFAFAELRMDRIWLNVGTTNDRARRSYEKAGFVMEGTLRHDRFEGGGYTSGDLMSVLRDEWMSRRDEA
jgi:RimJ/RimL family protein N-acetyltransferase